MMSCRCYKVHWNRCFRLGFLTANIPSCPDCDAAYPTPVFSLPIEALQMWKQCATAAGLTNFFNERCQHQLSVVHMLVSVLRKEHGIDHTSVLRKNAPQGLIFLVGKKNGQWKLCRYLCMLLRWGDLKRVTTRRFVHLCIPNRKRRLMSVTYLPVFCLMAKEQWQELFISTI